MTTTILLFCVVIIIILCVVAVYFFDRRLVKQIDLYEERLHKKGILKRHFVNKDKNKK